MNFSLSSALEIAAIAATAAIAGCGGADPAKSFASGSKSFELKDYKRARQHYEAGLKSEPGIVDALLTMAQIEFIDGKQSKADEYLSKAAALAGDDPDVIELAAQFAFHAKNLDLAAKMYRRLADDDTLDAKYRSKGWTGIGVVDYMQGDSARGQNERDLLMARARTAFLRATKIDRFNPCPHYHLGRIYRDVYGYPLPARDEFMRFTSLEKKDEYRVNRVQREYIPEIKKDISERNAASSAPVPPGGREACTKLLKQADAKFRAKRMNEAKELYSQAMKKDPQSAPAALGYANCLAALANNQEGFKAAFKAYSAVCRMDRSKGNFLKAGEYATKSRNFASAVELYSAALAYFPKDDTIAGKMVSALKDCGKSDCAAVYQLYKISLTKDK